MGKKREKGQGGSPPLGDHERVREIVKTLRECGEEVTQQAVAKQFRRETGRELKEVVVTREKKMHRGQEVLEEDARGPVVVRKKGTKAADLPVPLWSDIHGLRGSGFDGVVLIAAELQDQIKALEEQLAEVKGEIEIELEKVGADKVLMDDGRNVMRVVGEPYLGQPSREKLVQLGVSGTVIDKACSLITPSPYVKIGKIPGAK